MYTFYQRHKKGIALLFDVLFWSVTCLFFLRFSLLRPCCSMHIYKELLCFLTILMTVLITRYLTVPKLFTRGRYGLFWIVSVGMLLSATLFEFLLVKPDIEDKIFTTLTIVNYLFYIYLAIFIRDSLFFSWFLVFRLYNLQKDNFKTKQRASVMEHQSVQFTLPDQTEVSVPLENILYIQEKDHTTHVHCTDGEIIDVSDPFSYCKEMIPATLWVLDSTDKMVFHQNLSEYFANQPNQEVREITVIIPLTKRQFQIFEIIRQHPRSNTAFILENMPGKDSLRTIEREIAVLRSKGVITHMGSSKDGGYEVCGHNIVEVE